MYFICLSLGKSTEAQAFLSRHGDNGYQIIVRMRGLPYSCTPEQVVSNCMLLVLRLFKVHLFDCLG